MKLLTHIQPRADGTVIYTSDKARIVFAADETGLLVAEVADGDLIAKMLLSPNFEPADESDYAAAEALVNAASGKGAGLVAVDDLTGGALGDDGEEDDEPADEVAPGGLPQEANTPPKALPGKGKGAARKK
jgi:hypothetical protein